MDWMTSYHVKLNAEKTQFIWLSSSSVSRLPLSVGGVMFDVQLTMRHHVDNVVCSCFFQLSQLRSVRRSVTDEALHTLVQAYFASRIDCCNSPLYDVGDGIIRRL